jgi:phosphoserine phosphatase RsbU/P
MACASAAPSRPLRGDPVKILFIEDDPGDARLIEEVLRDALPSSTVIHCDRLSDALNMLAATDGAVADVVLLDLSLFDAQGLDGLDAVQKAAPQLPVVVLTGLDDEAVALRAVYKGAQDYLIKGYAITGGVLVRALRYAIERKRADDSVKREANARRLAEFREQFIGILGHDLRAPLNNIVLGSAALLESGGLSEVQADTARRLAASANRMARMISQLLGFTQARLGGGYPITREPTELQTVCLQVIDELRVVHPERTIEFESDGQVSGKWDPSAIGQVMSNLISNALQHGAPNKAIRVRLSRTGVDARIEVHNYGPSIPASVRSHIFEPFYQVMSGGRRSDRSDNLGLGLFISHQIALAHGGSIAVTSSEADGTSFIVTLPSAAGGVEAPPAAAARVSV